MLDARVEQVLHIGQAGMGDDGAISQRAWSPLHASLEPSHDAAGGDMAGNFVEQLIAFQPAGAQMSVFECGANTRISESRAEIRVLHDVATRLLENGVVGVQSGADGKPFVAGGGLNPGAAERRA